jgi:cystathionine gamma-lyase
VSVDGDELSLETLAIHGAHGADAQTGAVVPPIVLATTFAQTVPGQPGPYAYTRSGNPSREVLERGVAVLEGGRHGFAFSSGCAAMEILLRTLVPGDRVVAGRELYGGTYRLLEEVERPLGVETTYVDLTDLEATARALAGASLVIAESPTNPTLTLVDLEALAVLCKRKGVKLAVDNTFATPMVQRPLELGADVVLHSLTKYLNGHSDVLGGALVTSNEALAERLRFLQRAIGAVLAPFDCYMTLRGMKTLPIRMARHQENALELARRLETHPRVEHVRYPGLPSHPQHELAQRTMRGFGAMIAFDVRGGEDAARRLFARTQLFALAESLGGVESFLGHPATMSHQSMPREARLAAGIGDGLVRVSVGLEGVDDLYRDLDRALRDS